MLDQELPVNALTTWLIREGKVKRACTCDAAVHEARNRRTDVDRQGRIRTASEALQALDTLKRYFISKPEGELYIEILSHLEDSVLEIEARESQATELYMDNNAHEE